MKWDFVCDMTVKVNERGYRQGQEAEINLNGMVHVGTKV